MDVPSLTTGSNSWLNIQPLLRHSFLHMYENIKWAEERDAQLKARLEKVERGGADAENRSRAHFKSMIDTDKASVQSDMESLRLTVARLEKKIDDMDREGRERERELKQEYEDKLRVAARTGGDPVSGVTSTLASKIVNLEGTMLALSKRLDSLADNFDKHVFKTKTGVSNRSAGVGAHTFKNTTASSDFNVLMSDMNRVREELAFKCDGSFVKSSMDGKANKQSVADALHLKANKKTVQREMDRVDEKLKVEVKLLKDKMSELYKATQMPVGKITLALKEVAREVREGVRDSRDSLRMMNGRIENLELLSSQQMHQPPQFYNFNRTQQHHQGHPHQQPHHQQHQQHQQQHNKENFSDGGSIGGGGGSLEGGEKNI
ncbi:hypothetical protein TL16_g13232 [Triparma laevis f. inornata]|uniref:Uncharacterized protein n=1 Tax=Triparma laevis f. inornata TaxID=1714386 RepID=A0A9W7EZ34_9STRA|nr:hypothetical protein TL16_g13232 [Triparma laevis f. inornata]